MKKTLLALLLGVFSIISCNSPKKDIEWLKGGTLHKSIVSEWKQATDENKMATCADFVANTKKYTSIEDMKTDATAVKECIDEAVKGENTENMQTSEIAASCIILLNINK